MEELKGSMFISTKDIQIINDCSIRHAQREILALQDSLQIPKDKIPIRKYCEYWLLNYEDVIKRINPYR